MTDLKELQKAIEKADKILRPYAIICNPKYQKKSKTILNTALLFTLPISFRQNKYML